MSCEDCKTAQEGTGVFPYRWKNATILLSGCARHIGEIFRALDDHADDVVVGARKEHAPILVQSVSRQLAMPVCGDRCSLGEAEYVCVAANFLNGGKPVLHFVRTKP